MNGDKYRIDRFYHLKLQGPLGAILLVALLNLGERLSSSAPASKGEWASWIIQAVAAGVAIVYGLKGARKVAP